ncbi:hypothetical protein [Actinomadura soli]|uniref:hypothetical protein n=1 Tax=Actinomadura soli TaxID=2508997 RepID=UPI001E58EAFF|nr:hypothetical protein [Actinomadura soli]
MLRPGGRLLIADLARTPREYAAVLARLNAQDIRVRDLGWRAWWGSPWVPTRLLTARKPARSGRYPLRAPASRPA